jgi:hypothetical protein
MPGSAQPLPVAVYVWPDTQGTTVFAMVQLEAEAHCWGPPSEDKHTVDLLAFDTPLHFCTRIVADTTSALPLSSRCGEVKVNEQYSSVGVASVGEALATPVPAASVVVIAATRIASRVIVVVYAAILSTTRDD